jgi:dipeptidase D
MSELSKLEPQNVWQIFDLVCSIPHISKHEAVLAAELEKLATGAGLEVIQDTTGNLIIKRPAAPGFENAPRIIIQAHMDMVPASSGEFDFINCAITPYIEDGWVKAKNTTLGSDNGIGVAFALSLIMDKNYSCGALTVILTVDEEAGMSGARNLAPEHLDGKYLLNLDGSDNGFCIGCAGGARQEITFIPEYEAAPSGNPVKITVDGLPGGHSGTCIHGARGNAIKFLAEFLDQQPEIRLASLTGGTADNAIPYFAEAVGVSSKSIDELQQAANAALLLIKADCPNAKDMTLTIAPAEMPVKVWQEKFSKDILSALLLVPNEVMEFDDALGIVKTSSNLATIRTLDREVVIRTSQRSLVDEERDNICQVIAAHFKLFGGESEMGDVYPATPPKNDSTLLKKAIECGEEIGRDSNYPYAVHAGLESGWFFQKNPALEIISCGPSHTGFHTPDEKLEIASVGEFDRFLRALLLKLAK